MTIEVCFAQGIEILELKISQNEQNPLLISLRKISLVHCIQYVSLSQLKIVGICTKSGKKLTMDFIYSLKSLALKTNAIVFVYMDITLFFAVARLITPPESKVTALVMWRGK